jgi:peroxiredoxin
MTDISLWLDDQVASRQLTALVFFRGNWCPFCQGYLKELNGDFLRDLRAAGGEMIAVTAQSLAGAEAAKTDWALNYDAVSDPSLALANRFDMAITPKAQTPLAGVEGEYPNGMSQPGVVILDKTGKELVRWAINPSEMNGGGALDRPLPHVLWAALQSALNGDGPVSLEGPRLDPTWLKDNYPDAYKVFEAFMAAQTA